MIRVTIDGRECPVDRSQSVKIDYDASSLADVAGARQAPRAEIAVRATKGMRRLFGNADDPLTAERFNRTVHRAEIDADGAVLFRGTARLTGTVCRGGDAVYRVEVRGDTALWARSAALRKLSDAGLKCSATLTAEDIGRSWSDNRPVKFFPVNRVNRELSSSSVSLLPAQTVMTVDDYWPFVSVTALVEAIFRDAGYTVESRFMQTPLFRSLYMSGAYNGAADASSRKRTMDFLAGRTADATAVADSFGRVNMSATMKLNTVGNIVDTAAAYVTDSSGRSVATGFYSTNGCFSIDETTGVACFRPKSETVAGFEYSIAYVTDYRIESRTELKGFDSVYLGNDVYVRFKLANRFEDQQQTPLAGYAYKVMIFDYDPSCRYRLKAMADGQLVTLLDTTARMTALTLPAGRKYTAMQLLRAESGSNVYNSMGDDWALYWGFVEERGRTEIELRVRTPAERLSPLSVKRFDELFAEGAEAGMTFTLLKRTTVRPVFASTAGYGSRVDFGDVAPADIRQSELLEALGQMFDLRFCTDEVTKRVFIEPYGDFFSGGVVDWSDRIDLTAPVVMTDPSLGMHETVTLAYAEEDGIVRRFNNSTGRRLGRWSFAPDSQAALDGEQTLRNPLFAPTLNERDKYFEARSASIMQVRDTDEESGDDTLGNFSTRIVRYAGLRPLAEGETWGEPFAEGRYPMAAFHFAGDARTEGFSLCFEDRDGVTGLHEFHGRRLKEESEGLLLTLSLHLLPEEVAALHRCAEDGPSVRSLFRLDIGGRTAGALYTLRSIEGYDPSQPTVRCTFTKIDRTI